MNLNIAEGGCDETMQQPNAPKREDLSVMRAVALFLDGMSRAAIFSFGPSLIYRLANGTTLKLGLDCAKIAYLFPIVVAAYLIGRGLGASLAQKIRIPKDNLAKYVARIAGVATALHVFTFGAGLKSVWWLVMIRFISATLVGILCVVTKDDKMDPESDLEAQNAAVESGLNEAAIRGTQRRHGYVDFASITAKTYMTAFAVSILTGGLLYRHAAGDATFRDLTGSKQFTLSPLFLIAVSLIAESILRCVFALFDSETNSSSVASTERSNRLAVTKSPPRYKIEGVRDHLTPLRQRSRSRSIDSEGFAPCRDRLESSNSIGGASHRIFSDTGDMEFFDCNSVLSDMEDLNIFDDENDEGEDNNVQVSQYRNKKCVYPDGHPAYVPNGDSPDIIPPNYLKLCGGDEIKAEKMWRATQEWRRKEAVWKIHAMPNEWFSKIKKAYPHYIHGVSKKGFPVIYEQPGKMKLKQLFRDGCKVTDMLRHYIFFLEYISNHVCAKPEVRQKHGIRPPPLSSSTWNLLVVMDVKGAGLSSLSGDVVSYLSKAGDINNSHYPLSMKRAFLVNSPYWLAGLWKTIDSIIPESVQVDILSSHQYLNALREYIDEDQIPREYGGSSPYKLGEHPFEEELFKVVEEASEMDEDGDVEIAEKEVPDATHSSDRNESSLTTKIDGDDVENCTPNFEDNTWNSNLTSTNQTTSGLHARRRRAASPDRNQPDDDQYDDDDKKIANSEGEDDIFFIVSIMHGLWSAIQSMIETSIPLWILLPPQYGGLGYAPSRSGVAMFSSVTILLWIMRTKVSKVISEIPSKAPLRSFRIGVGAESVLLLLLATIPKTVGPEQRADNVLVMAITIIIMSCIVLSSLLGRASSTILHRIACVSFAESEMKPTGWLTTRYGVEQLQADCQNGKITTRMNFASEILGVLAIAPICSWSLSQERPTPFDGTCCLYVACLVTLVLYVCSFSLYLNVVGEFAPHPREGCGGDARAARKCCSFLYEVATVLVGDMASLFEEVNWSLTPLLGHSKGFHATTEKTDAASVPIMVL